jgi:hypothetical protein
MIDDPLMFAISSGTEVILRGAGRITLEADDGRPSSALGGLRVSLERAQVMSGLPRPEVSSCSFGLLFAHRDCIVITDECIARDRNSPG